MHLSPIKSLILITVAGSFATAADFSFTGSLTGDDSSQLFSFSLASASTITLRTYSYAGRLDQTRAVVPRGGFDPILALFDSTGLLINENDDGYANVATDSVTGQHWDSYIYTMLAAGTYTISLTQYNNFPNGPYLSDGFSKTGQPKFTNSFSCSNGGFCDRTGNSRTANWEFDVLGAVSATAVPEPNVAALLATGIVLAGVFRGRKAKRNFTVHKSGKNFISNTCN